MRAPGLYLLKEKIKGNASFSRQLRAKERNAKGAADLMKLLAPVWRGERGHNLPGPEEFRDNALAIHRMLHHERTMPHREKSRAAQLAYAFLRGKPLLKVEPEITRPHTRCPNWELVWHFANNHREGIEWGGHPAYLEWLEAAEFKWWSSARPVGLVVRPKG